jgi:hypothetical protein
LNVRLVADEITPNNLLVGDCGIAIGCTAPLVALEAPISPGEGVRGGEFGVEGREPVTQLLGVSLAGVQLGLPGTEDELETGGKSCFEYGDGDGGNEILSLLDPGGEYDDVDDPSISVLSSPMFLSTISKLGDLFRAGVVGSVNLLSVALEKVNLNP